jgi:hypothetical protein
LSGINTTLGCVFCNVFDNTPVAGLILCEGGRTVLIASTAAAAALAAALAAAAAALAALTAELAALAAAESVEVGRGLTCSVADSAATTAALNVQSTAIRSLRLDNPGLTTKLIQILSDFSDCLNVG